MSKFKVASYLYFALEIICSCTGIPPPVRNFTTITLYTDPKTWNEAIQICADQGGRILDITYYSLFSIMLTFASESPWEDLPIYNGPPAWIGLHRRVTPLGDLFYSQDCQRLTNFKVAYWNTNSSYTIMDGEPESFCVYHQINKSTTNEITSFIHDFTRAKCQEANQFYCLSENGSCTFEMVSDVYGDTSEDFTPDNDETYSYESEEQCADLCLNSWSIYPHSDIHVVEECWGFTTSATECRLHKVLKPSYFDKASNKIASPSKTLFIKRCFSSAVNTEMHLTSVDASVEPNTTCGTPVMGDSTMAPLQVFVYLGRWTWNEAYGTCKERGLELLHIHQDNYTAVQQLVDKYAEIQSIDYLWLGLHEPDPINHTNTKVWADCSSSDYINWDPFSPPSPSITDTSFCTVLDTSSNYWYTVMCNEQHYFICTGDHGANHSYNNGISNTVGLEISLGPYDVTESSCRYMCSTLTYENQECWGYAVLTDDSVDSEDGVDCFLYFINSSDPNTQAESSNEPYTLFVKMVWSDTLLNGTDIVDSRLMPTSCCDVKGIKSECPQNDVPLYSANIPTTGKLQFVLYRNLATWNEAQSACKTAGGSLAQLNEVSKLLMLRRYIDTWIADEDMSNEVWIGLSQLHPDDPCSLRWNGDCTSPEWTDFADESYTDPNTNYCIALGKVSEYIKMSCNKRLQFVCEINAGACNIQQSVYDIDCNLGPQGASLAVSSDTCLTDCRDKTYNKMECWAAVIVDTDTCNLMFYVDPEYCKGDNIEKEGYDVRFKTCFSATVLDSSPFVAADESLLPKTSCFDFIPVELSTAVCAITTSISTTPPTELSVSSSTSRLESSTTMNNSLTRSVTSIFSTEISVTTKDALSTRTLGSTSTPASSTTKIVPNMFNFTAKPIFIWPCLCYTYNISNMTPGEWHEWVVSTNTVGRYNTSQHRRKLTSVTDGRTSSITIGLIGSAVLVVLTVCLILADIPRISRSAVYIHRNALKVKRRRRT